MHFRIKYLVIFNNICTLFKSLWTGIDPPPQKFFKNPTLAIVPMVEIADRIVYKFSLYILHYICYLNKWHSLLSEAAEYLLPLYSNMFYFILLLPQMVHNILRNVWILCNRAVIWRPGRPDGFTYYLYTFKHEHASKQIFFSMYTFPYSYIQPFP